ncbi:heterokaryon incompatibility protein-domain-containing protein [Lasiosphaeria miniovina]|uniref:Heterokaryon incompatibility protein-domain-containing protein n=1 Tax=Lasiosphaeria miniovina TaxID=1954250 RepID=A0AA40AD59_9PEZI|nr:heterokaryon incompatibility protein-domain-containing protein [Lasiosphaeria miniovina]KAK0713693.1 heterokaryon incompatibility protein-domain-containing protein [Lasiosphaeria miniovina]
MANCDTTDEPNSSTTSRQQLYAQLAVPPGSRSIRLLDLDPRPPSQDGGPLTGHLRVARLADQPSFTTLSYVWDDKACPSSALAVLPQGVDLEISANCLNALRQIRRQFGAVTIWIDNVCINQDDEVEKESQIPLMQDIYSSEHLVRIQQLLGTPWISRAWTFQELVLSENPVLLCGDNLALWEDVINAAAVADVTPSMNTTLGPWHSLAGIWLSLPRPSLRRPDDGHVEALRPAPSFAELLDKFWDEQGPVFNPKNTFPAALTGGNENDDGQVVSALCLLANWMWSVACKTPPETPQFRRWSALFAALQGLFPPETEVYVDAFEVFNGLANVVDDPTIPDWPGVLAAMRSADDGAMFAYFVSTVQKLADEGRCLFTLPNGMGGSGPLDMAEGDEVFTVAGVRAPLVLRRVEGQIDGFDVFVLEELMKNGCVPCVLDVSS